MKVLQQNLPGDIGEGNLQHSESRDVSHRCNRVTYHLEIQHHFLLFCIFVLFAFAHIAELKWCVLHSGECLTGMQSYLLEQRICRCEETAFDFQLVGSRDHLIVILRPLFQDNVIPYW